eukprot:GEMP01100291.1.p1 GENE.GEMP01100291.1~~GEMP01100291.1.p1  ORF type:complete len:203 (+),score=31.10 GEMP01100291.1:198-806(+)
MEIDDVEVALRRHALLIEFEHLIRYAPLGVYVTPSFTNLREWHGILMLPAGFYRGAMLKFMIDLAHYPDKCPVVRFLSSVYHPNIDPETRELDMSAFSPWQPGKQYITAVLQHMREQFLKTSWFTAAKLPKNPIAQELFTKDPVSFQREAQQCVNAEAIVPDGSPLSVTAPFEPRLLERLQNNKASFLQWYLDEYVPTVQYL